MPDDNQNSQNTQPGIPGQDTQLSDDTQAVQNPSNPTVIPPQETPTEENEVPTPPINVQQPSQPTQNIEPIYQPQENPMSPSGVGKKSGVVFWIAVILFALSMLALIAYFIGAYKEGRVNFGKKPTLTPIATIEPTLNPTTSTPDPTADWKTYTEQSIGLSFKYPNDWTTEKTSGSTLIILISPNLEEERGLAPMQISIDSATDANGNVHFDKVQQAKEHYLKSLENNAISEESLVSEKPSITIEGKLLGPGPNAGSFVIFTLVQLEQKVLVVQLGDESIRNSFDQILSTFKFMENTSSPNPSATPSASPASGFGM